MGLEAPGATRGVQGRVISRSGECDQGGAGAVKEPNYRNVRSHWVVD